MPTSETIDATGKAVERDGTFPSGRLTLHSRSVLPATGQMPWARLALLHGYGDHCGRYDHFFRWLVARGVACHTFDFRGHGRSPAPRGYVRRWDEFVDDLGAFLALDELAPSAASIGGPLLVLGHSHGGLVAAAAAIRGMLDGSRVAGCILTAPYFRGRTPVPPLWRAIALACDWVCPRVRVPTGLRDTSMSADPAMREESARDPFIHRIATPRWYRTTLKVQADVMARAGEFRLPLLCFAAGEDDVADAEAAARFVERVGSADKRLIHVPAGRHELLRDLGREETFKVIERWMRERVMSPPPLVCHAPGDPA